MHLALYSQCSASRFCLLCAQEKAQPAGSLPTTRVTFRTQLPRRPSSVDSGKKNKTASFKCFFWRACKACGALSKRTWPLCAVYRGRSGARAVVMEAVLQYCCNIRELEAYQWDNLIIGLLNRQPRVHRLDFSFSDFAPETTDTLLELLNLRKLCINWHISADHERKMRYIVRKCPELTHFSFKFGYSLLEFRVSTLFGGLTKLVAFNFDSPSIDDAALSIVMDFCPLIEHLDLRGNNELSDTSLYNVATRLKLKSIAFNSTYNITDQGLFHLKHCSSTLKEVHIAQIAGFRGFGTPKITLAAISMLLYSTNLTLYDWRCRIMFVSFDVSVCACATTLVVSAAATDVLLSSIAEFCTQLQHLNIVLTGGVQVPQYTSAGLYAVIHNCPFLRTIRVNRNMDQTEFGEILNLYKHLFVYSTSNAEFLYDVMDM